MISGAPGAGAERTGEDAAELFCPKVQKAYNKQARGLLVQRRYCSLGFRRV
jgi:hypothetical protein